MGDATVGLALLAQVSPVLAPWLGLIGVLAGTVLAAVANYYMQRQHLNNEREAERARWRREDETRNIDERRQTYTDFLKNARWMLEKIEHLDVALKDLTEAHLFMSEKMLTNHKISEEEVKEGRLTTITSERKQVLAQEAHQDLEQVRQRIEATIDRVEQLQKDLRWDINEAYTLLTKIEIFAYKPVREAARELFAHNQHLLDDKNKIANEGVQLRRAMFAELDSDSSLDDSITSYKKDYEYHRSQGKTTKDMILGKQNAFNHAVREELGIPSV
jgi:vacuolar-type H+-ATPase subunit I/STV1